MDIVYTYKIEPPKQNKLEQRIGAPGRLKLVAVITRRISHFVNGFKRSSQTSSLHVGHF
jgi:hypothetical protein